MYYNIPVIFHIHTKNIKSKANSRAMKKQMSSFDIAAVVGELQQLVGFKVEKVFSPINPFLEP